MGKSEKRKAPEPGTEQVFGNGTIMKVKVTNFMCHQNLEVEFGPRINFIVGENGSGKSAVLTALMVCLGTRKGAKERTDKGIKGFIREGSNFSKVEVTIRNVGMDAFERERNHGEFITVERNISLTSSNYKIRNQWGKEIGNSLSYLHRMTDHFNIDVDNPIVVMTQDSSRQFLHSGKDTDKYKFFVKATLIEDIQHKLAWVKEQVKEMDRLVAEKEAEMEPARNEVEKLQLEADSFARMDALRADVVEHRNRLAWAQVYEQETLLRQLENDLANLTGPITKQLEEHKIAQRAMLSECENTAGVVNDKLRAFDLACKELEERVGAAQEKSSDLGRAARQRDTKLKSLQNSIKSATDSKRALEESINTQRMTIEQQSQAQDATLRRVIDEAKQKLAAEQRDLNEASSNVRRVEQEMSTLTQRIRHLGASYDATKGRVEELRNQAKKLSQDKGDVLRRIHPNMPNLKRMVEQKKNLFDKPPIGPIGLHIKIKNSQWEKVVEEHIGGILGTFLVGSMRDRQTLDKLMRENNIRPDIITTNFNRERYPLPAEKIPSKSLTTMLDILDIDNDVVFNTMIDNSTIECIALVPDERQAKVLVRDPRQNVRQAYTKSRRIDFRGKSTGDHGFREGRQPRLVLDHKQALADLNLEVKHAEQEAISAKAKKDAEVAKEAKLKTEWDHATKFRREVNARLHRAKAAVEEAELNAKENIDDIPALDIDQLESELASINEKLEGKYMESSKTLTEAKASADQAYQKAKVEEDALRANLQEEITKGDALTKEQEAAYQTLQEAKDNCKFYDNKERELKEKIEQDKKVKEELQLAVSLELEEAKGVCDRETAQSYLGEGGKELPLEDVKKNYTLAKRRVEEEKKRHDRPQEDVLKSLKDAKNALKRLEDTVGNSRGPCNALKRGQKARQRMLTQTANELNKSVSHRFNHYLSKKGGAGRVKVDFSNAELELVINPSAADGAANKVKDIRSLSGGERSFCTLALTLGIGEQIESPFRAMDEFDVFMDAVNRKVSMDALIDFSRDYLNQDKQFLFITPQDISAVDASAPDIRVQKMKAARSS